MYYYETDNKTGKRIGIASGILYVLLWGLLFLIINITFPQKEFGEGILINFGDTEDASGLADPGENAVTAQQQQQQQQQTQSKPQDTHQEMMTQTHEDAPEVPEVTPQQTSPAEETKPGETKPAETAPAEQPRVADPRLNFPGRTEDSKSTSEGTTQGAGNQGAPEGSPEGSHEGSGVGAGGTGFDLAGRSVVGTLPPPVYGANKQGRVIVEITVDAGGVVVNAVYRARGSTTNDSELVNAALNAARRSRFNLIDSDDLQTGTITYNFRLK